MNKYYKFLPPDQSVSMHIKDNKYVQKKIKSALITKTTP